MSTIFENVAGEPVDIPSLDVRVPKGGTFTVEADVAAGLVSNPHFRVKKAVKADKEKS